jgi:hypothetical protein
MATTSSAFRQLTDQNAVGTLFGASSTDIIGFYGVTTAVGKVGTNLATLSASSGVLASSIAIILNNLGLIVCTSVTT